MLRVESVSYEINKRYLLKDITFSIRKGEMVAILGANGAGKSTLMKILCREKLPTEGKVVYGGRNLNGYTAKELAEKRATLYQQNAITLAFTVEEVVLMGRYGKAAKETANADRVALRETMEICGIGHLAERSMLTLSGGEQQRVHLARVLAQVWDNREALLLLDEPIANMDMLYQHQTLAIANALAKKGFMVVCVLHEINLAAQYADRVIMLKGGRKWWDGAPEEVFTSRNIFTAFGVHTAVQTNPRTLITQVMPNGIKMDAAAFNSYLADAYNKRSLRERFISYRDEYPAKPLWQVADTLGVSEADLVLLGLGENATLLRPEMESVLRQVAGLGVVEAETCNPYCESRRQGVYRNFSKEGYTTLLLGADIDLRIFTGRWKIAVAVEDKGRESLQFFDGSGRAVHKIYLTEGSYREAFLDLVGRFVAAEQVAPAIGKKSRRRTEERRDADVDISDFHRAWNEMRDTHEFFGLIRRHGLNRMQALRLAPPGRAMQLSLESFRRMIAQCLVENVPVMMFTANEGCVQINTGVPESIARDGAWICISGASGGRLRLNEDAVHSVWHVVKPTSDGDINALELYDAEGGLIVQFFGARKPGIPELESWREALAYGLTSLGGMP